ncbi:hypothetical protein ABZW11_28660 [Nonomuraea sp. NPDC004580]|uniref:hypothetical protein n=1 Tax=Nonomuraea sp. NPDC004580 TaxID=3154552 RepID=UPI0033AAB98A
MQGGDSLGGLSGMGILDRITAHPVSVLEVDPKILDGLGGELAQHLVMHGGRQSTRQVEDGSHLGRAGKVRLH